jgi:hypothetical protein
LRAPIANRLRAEFERELRRVLPGFRPDTESVIPPGWRCFHQALAPDRHFFVLLNISRHFDDFQLDCAWSTTRLLPDLSRPVEEPYGMFQLHTLWAPRRGHGWTLTPGAALGDPFDPLAPLHLDPEERFPVADSVARVSAEVEDAVRSLAEVGIPRLERMAAAGASYPEEVD